MSACKAPQDNNLLEQTLQENNEHSLLYAPRRNKQYNSITKKTDTSSLPCPFCTEMAAGNDERYFILKRGTYCVISLNPFPYANGHILIIPYQHKEQPSDLSPETRAELMEYSSYAVSVLKKTYDFDRANIGINQGRCAGAITPDHLHVHVVPRSYNDRAFIHLIGKTPTIMIDLTEMYNNLKPAFDLLD